jgi:hypothetical protein
MQEEYEGTRILLGIPLSDCRTVVKEPVVYQQSIHWIASTGISFFKMLVSRMTDDRRQNVVLFCLSFFCCVLYSLVELCVTPVIFKVYVPPFSSWRLDRMPYLKCTVCSSFGAMADKNNSHGCVKIF